MRYKYSQVRRTYGIAFSKSWGINKGIQQVHYINKHSILREDFSIAFNIAINELEIMEKEFEIPVEDEIRRDVTDMCNLSEGIWEAALLEGKKEGKAEGKKEGKAEALASVILQMKQKGLTPKEIADILDKKEEEIEAVLLGKEFALV